MIYRGIRAWGVGGGKRIQLDVSAIARYRSMLRSDVR